MTKSIAEVSAYALCTLDMVCMGDGVLKYGQLGYNCEYTQLERAELVIIRAVSGSGTMEVKLHIRPTPLGREIAEGRIEARWLERRYKEMAERASAAV